MVSNVNSLKTKYAELLSLTQLFLLRRHPLKKARPTRSDSRSPSRPSPAAVSTTPSDAAVESRELSPKPQTGASTCLDITEKSSQAQKEEAQTVSPPPDPAAPKTRTGGQLEPLTDAMPPRDDRELRSLFSRLFPHIPLCTSIPDDAEARRIQRAWQEKRPPPAVLLLSFQRGEAEREFLDRLSQAISLRLAPAKVIPASQGEQRWRELLAAPALRLLIAHGSDLRLQRDFTSLYREIRERNQHFLGPVPLLLLSDYPLYLKNPALKSVLWRAICDELKLR